MKEKRLSEKGLESEKEGRSYSGQGEGDLRGGGAVWSFSNRKDICKREKK